MSVSLSAVSRPIMRYNGGKWRMAKNILKLFPPHEIYVEPFGGGAGILLQKPKSKIDVYNDLDGDIVNLFRVVREYPEELARLVEWTPFAREEFELSYEMTDDPIERARRTLVRSFMGFGSAAATKGSTGFRGMDGGSHSYNRWNKHPKAIIAISERLKSCVIENLPYAKILDRHDSENTLFYLDPPYLMSTRTSITTTSGGRYYNHEMTDEQHMEMLERVKRVKGMVVISGYASDLYDSVLDGWIRYSFQARASGHRGTVMREEVVWCKPYEIGGLFSNPEKEVCDG